MATQPVQACPQVEERVSSAGGFSIPLNQIVQSQTSQRSSSPDPGRITGSISVTADPARNSDSPVRKISLQERFPVIFSRTCDVLGLLLVLIFGITQLVAQDKSIVISKESELVTLALSCSDEKVKYTSICQQFLDKFPDGPAISRRREDGLSGSPRYHDPRGAHSVHDDFEYLAVYLATMDQFVQKQNRRFQSALNESDLTRSLAQMKEIDEAREVFFQNLMLRKSAMTMPRGEGVSALTKLDGTYLAAVYDPIQGYDLVRFTVAGVIRGTTSGTSSKCINLVHLEPFLDTHAAQIMSHTNLKGSLCVTAVATTLRQMTVYVQYSITRRTEICDNWQFWGVSGSPGQDMLLQGLRGTTVSFLAKLELIIPSIPRHAVITIHVSSRQEVERPRAWECLAGGEEYQGLANGGDLDDYVE
ncbi:hypothetical protein NPX13_g9674 [Xylaria arbuscula]|uniref:Uncharacterized protein n=1 Tax=Xylaria arbuscula TaxID=114810 RepID=A0A9W8N659_9PEZI|nr:hypothetical protein NPX13_g9674 [Xylaria arbuscula]